MIRIYIHGKFTTASRKAANVTVSGNSVFLSESSFKTYANYKCFWVFSNDEGEGNTNTSSSSTTSVSYTRYVATGSSNLNVRSGPGTSYSRVGSLSKGTAVTVYEVSGNWSRIGTNQWVCSTYLSASKVTTTSSSSNSSSSYNVKITASALNIRTGASTKYKSVGTYKKGTVVTITQTSGNWGKTSKGWIYLGYTTKTTSSTTSTTTTSSTSYTTGTYKVTKANLLNVRSGPGTSYSTKTYKQLTSNARAQNKKLGNYYANGYKKGVVCTVTQVSGNWGKTASGWIYLPYCTKQ